jgi:hypothetical protein
MLNEFLARRVFYGFLPSNSQKGCYPIQAKPTTLGAQRRSIVYGSSAVAPFVNLPCCCMDSPWAWLDRWLPPRGSTAVRSMWHMPVRRAQAAVRHHSCSYGYRTKMLPFLCRYTVRDASRS